MTALPVPQATAADIPELVRVINAAYRVEDLSSTAIGLRRPRSRQGWPIPGGAFLAIQDPDPPGLAAAVYVERRETGLYFAMLSVDPARQGQGHARRLIEAVETRAREAGCTALEIEVADLREELPAFYQKLGFVVTGEAPFHSSAKLERPAHLVLMRKGVRAEK